MLSPIPLWAKDRTLKANINSVSSLKRKVAEMQTALAAAVTPSESGWNSLKRKVTEMETGLATTATPMEADSAANMRLGQESACAMDILQMVKAEIAELKTSNNELKANNNELKTNNNELKLYTFQLEVSHQSVCRWLQNLSSTIDALVSRVDRLAEMVNVRGNGTGHPG